MYTQGSAFSTRLAGHEGTKQARMITEARTTWPWLPPISNRHPYCRGRTFGPQRFLAALGRALPRPYPGALDFSRIGTVRGVVLE